MKGEGDARREFSALHGDGRVEERVLAVNGPNRRVKSQVKGDFFPRSLFYRTEASFGHVTQHDAGGRRDREKAAIVEGGEIQAEAVEVVGEKDGAANFGIDGVAEGIGKSEPESERREFVDVGDEAPVIGQEGLHFELLLMATLRMADAERVFQ